MPKIRALPKDALSKAPSTSGLTRHFAFKGEEFLVVRSHGDPGISSDWHHHGDYDVYGYVVSGTVRFENGNYAINVDPGDFFHVPAHTIHRDVNPSPDEGQEMVLFMQGSGPMVVNVDGPEKT